MILAVLCIFAGCNRQSPEEMLAKAEETHKMQDYKVALEQYAMLIDEHPSSPQAEAAAFATASIYHNEMHQPQQAVDAYNRYLSMYPDGPRAGISLFLTGWMYNNELRKLDSAAIAYKTFLAKYPDNEMAPSAQFELENLGKSPEDLIPDSSAQSPPQTASVPN